MSVRQGDWVILLGAGDGTRLSSLMTDARSDAVPKQFCSLNGGPSLLQDALQRAWRVVSLARVCAVVARQHERHRRHMVWSLPTRKVIVRPRNCGTANSVLLGLLRILEHDPLARVVFLTADHYVRDEVLLADSVRGAAMFTGDHNGLALLGIEPDDIDLELGYIVPGGLLEDVPARSSSSSRNRPLHWCAIFIARGTVWNSFIFWAQGTRLLELIRGRLSAIGDDESARDARCSRPRSPDGLSKSLFRPAGRRLHPDRA
jgi:mannose-1-phosphate guanylyltransferase